MRTVIFLCLTAAAAVAQQTPDEMIRSEFQSVMDLAAPPPEGQQLKEEEAKARAELFKKSLEAFTTKWKARAGELSVGRFQLGKALSLTGANAEAIPHLRAFTETHTDDPDVEEALLTLGSAYLSTGDHPGAAQVFSRFLRERPDSTQRRAAEFYLAIARYQQGADEEALQLLKQVAESGEETPIVADANIKQVEVLRDIGRADEARQRLAGLLEQNEDAPYLLALKEQLEQIGKEAPELVDIDHWLQGQPATLKDLRGRVVVINFFADFYESCQAELSMLAKMAEENRDQPVEFLALTKFYRPIDKMSLDDQARLVQNFVGGLGVKFRVGVAKEFTNLRNYAVRGIPTTVVIGKDGRIVHYQAGSTRNNERAREHLANAIRRAR